MSPRPVPTGLLAAALLLCAHAAAAEVFINELHYDDSTASGDTGERIEIVATAGETLSAYSVSLYNGSSSPGSATSYASTAVPGGSVVSCGASVRIATVSYASNGLQNGASDGIALVDGSGQLVQFISYEGAITGSGGPASGRSSQNLPVAEGNDTAPGTSLQLRGTGSGYANFNWATSSAQSFGACNSGQSFGDSGNAAPSILATTPLDNATGVAAASDLAVNFSEPVTLSSGAFALNCSLSGTLPLSHASSGSAFAISTNAALRGGESCTLSINATGIVDGSGQRPSGNTAIDFTVATSSGVGDYYRRVNSSSPSQLRCSLHQTIRGHTVYPYSGSGTSTWSILEIADENPNASGQIVDVYRNRSYTKVSDRAGTGSGITYNREHTWPNSLGFGSATGNLGLPYAPYTDTHMLYLSDTTYNSDRGNRPYANCSGCGERVTEVNNGRGGGSGTYPGNSNWVQSPDGNGGSFEIWGRRKGDIARAVLYMAIRYEGATDPNTGQTEPDLELTDDRSRIVITSASPAYMGLLSTLLAWHQADPPDAAERARDEVIYSFQGNRNPFVDHPEWATNALFTSARPASCQLAN